MPDSLRPHHTHQYVDLHALLTPVTKASLDLKPAAAHETIRRALELARGDRPGPVHLQITNEDARLAATDIRASSPPLTRRAPDADISPLHDLIASSRRPIILAGLGLEPERPYAALRRLAESASAPVIVTPKAKGALPDDHPLAAGTIGLTRTDPVYDILNEADLVLAVGFDIVELVKPWEHSAPLVWIANWENRDPVLNPVAQFNKSISETLNALADAHWHTAEEWGQRRVAKPRAQFASRDLPAAAEGRVLPQTVLRVLQEAAPRDAILTTDVGSHKIFFSLNWQTYTPNSFFVSNGLSTMGFALPAALAARLAQPERRVICTVGDAGLAMVMGELGVLRRLGGRDCVVVFNDAALDLIRAQQTRAGKPVYGTEFVNPSFVDIARAYGLAAWRVTNESECAAAVREALVLDAPSLIEVLTDARGYW